MTKTLDKDFKLAISKIKNDIKNTQTKIIYQANNELILLYFRIGKILEENSRYGNGFIKNLAREIKIDLPNIERIFRA